MQQADGLSLPTILTLQVLHALPWIAVTFFAARLARRFPLRNRKHFWRNATVHLGGGVLVVLAVNIVQGVLRVLFGFSPLSTFFPQVIHGLLLWGHIALGVYGTLVLAWSIVPRGRPGEAKAVDKRTSSYLQTLTARKGTYNTTVATSNIDWIEGARDYVLIYSKGASYMGNQRMNWLECHLDPQDFARIHRSTIVNLNGVVAYKPLSHGDYELKLQDGTTLKLTRTRRDAVLALLKQIL
ncbi:MAG TPA: LytTR family DNA-binding domain-containing protein [Rhodothermales bacterium]|nr:LytTR family DNA-binding domain-containing protein [Rhodothermales bacterium]